MKTQEHLDKIVAKCRTNLALAKKRTPGEWGVLNSLWTARSEDDADYIAACAGAAEAGWRATIATIEGLREMAIGDQYSTNMTAAIIGAWPEELL